MLLKDRTFAVTAFLTLAVTIGANAAIFSIVRSVLLKPLPVPASERIAIIYNSYPNAGAPKAQAGVPDYFDRQSGTDVFEEQALYRRQGLTLGDASGAERLSILRATPSFFRLVQAHPAQGRIFSEQEGEEGHDKVVMLSHGIWMKKFGGDASAIGKTMRLNGQPYEITGVLPSDFKFLWHDIDLRAGVVHTKREVRRQPPQQQLEHDRAAQAGRAIARAAGNRCDQRAQRRALPQFRQI